MTNPKGRFGVHGGQYIPETLMNAVIELEAAYDHYKNDEAFNRELTELLNEYAGRPSRLYFAKKMTEDLGGAKIYLKREDLNHTGAHKINNVLGQALLAKRMGKTRLIAETGAGQHGVATATAAALMGMECVVFMGEEDTIKKAYLELGRLYYAERGAAPEGAYAAACGRISQAKAAIETNNARIAELKAQGCVEEEAESVTAEPVVEDVPPEEPASEQEVPETPAEEAAAPEGAPAAPEEPKQDV